MDTKYDIVVIGAGSGGLTAAVGFSKVGKKVLLVEKEHMGGECTNSGCIPSKALLHHAKAFYTAQKVAGWSDEAEEYRKSAFSYVRSIVASILESETPESFKKLGIDVVVGEAEFISVCAIKVGSHTYEYKNAVIATGSSPRTITIEGMVEKDILTNQNIFDLDDVPQRLLVIGGGPIGLEMGQAFAMLGSRVTIADINNRFANLEDAAISPLIQQEFQRLGVKIHLNAFISHVENKQALFDIKSSDGKTVVQTERVAYDKVIIAVGRVPNIPKGLASAGILADTHGVLVDSQHHTSNKYVYAIGDVAQQLKFTHTADDAARQVVTRVVSKGLLGISTKKAVPKVTYTFPEIAQVGLSYGEALSKYSDKEIMRIEVPFSENDRAKTDIGRAHV